MQCFSSTLAVRRLSPVEDHQLSGRPHKYRGAEVLRAGAGQRLGLYQTKLRTRACVPEIDEHSGES